MDKFFILLIALSGIPMCFFQIKELLSAGRAYLDFLSEGFDTDTIETCACQKCSGFSLAEAAQHKIDIWIEVKNDLRRNLFERKLFFLFYLSITALSINYSIINL